MEEVNRPSTFLLLRAYREGILIQALRNDLFAVTANALAEKKLMVKLPIEHERYTVSYLTDEGTKVLQDNLRTWLTSYFLYQVKPALMVGDIIEVSKSLQNESRAQYVKPPHNAIEAGRYRLTHIGVDSFQLEGYPVPHVNGAIRVDSYVCRRYLTLDPNTIGTTEQEVAKRFEKVKAKSVLNKILHLGLDNLEAIELLDQIRTSGFAKARWDSASEADPLIMKGYIRG